MKYFIYNNIRIFLIYIIGISVTIANPRLIYKNSSFQESNEEFSGQKSIVHVVQKGEYIDFIAKKYGVSRQDILIWNNLTNSRIIKINQKIIIWLPEQKPQEDKSIEEKLKLLYGDSYINKHEFLPTKTLKTEIEIKYLKFSPSGRYIAYSDREKRLIIRSRENDKFETIMFDNKHYSGISSIVFNKKEDKIAIIHSFGFTMLDLTSENKWVQTFSVMEKTYSVSFSPNNSILVSTHGKYGKIRNVDNGNLIKTISYEDIGLKAYILNRPFIFSKFNDKSNELIICNKFGKFFVLNGKNFVLDRIIKISDPGLIVSIAFSHNGDYCAASVCNGIRSQIVNVDFVMNTVIIKEKTRKLLSHLEISKDGEYLAGTINKWRSLIDKKNSTIWKTTDGQKIKSINSRNTYFDPSNGFAVSIIGKNIQWWNLKGKTPNSILEFISQIESEFPLDEYINERDEKINALYEPQGEFENTKMYNERLKNAKKNQKIIENEYITKIELARRDFKFNKAQNIEKIRKKFHDERTKVNLSIELGKYNADKEYFPIKLLESGEIKNIYIPLSFAREFKNNFNNLIITGYRQVNLNLEWEYVDVIINDPVTGEIYPFSEKSSVYLPGITQRKISATPIIETEILFNEYSGNELLDAEESGEIKIILINNGKGDAFDFTVNLNHLAGYRLKSDFTQQIPILPAGEEDTVTFKVFADKNIPTGSTNYELVYREKNGFEPNNQTFSIETQKLLLPHLSVQGTTFEDESQNNKIEKNEKVIVTVRIINDGIGMAKNIKVKVLLKKNVFFTNDSPDKFEFDDLAPGEVLDIQFTVIPNSRVTKIIPIEIEIAETNINFRKTFPLNLAINKELKQADMILFSIDIERNIPISDLKNNNSFAVVIGNSDYQNAFVSKVDFAVRDAKFVKKYLIKTFGYKDENIFYYENATLAHLKVAFKKLQNAVIKNESDVFIYYSGHGAPDIESKVGYLVPVDCDPNYVNQGGYSLNTLYEIINNLGARNVTVALDACFSGTTQGGTILKDISPVYIKISPNELTLENYSIFFSASGDQVSTWYRQKKHSLFTYYFLKGIQGEAEINGDNKLTISELKNYLYSTVPSKAKTINNTEQVPQVFTDDAEKTFLNWAE